MSKTIGGRGLRVRVFLSEIILGRILSCMNRIWVSQWIEDFEKYIFYHYFVSMNVYIIIFCSLTNLFTKKD